jgi:peptide deformylase
MALRPIKIFPDPILSQQSALISLPDLTVGKLIEDLLDTMNDSPGVGLAAPQIGVLKKVSVIHINKLSKNLKSPSTNHGIITLINPVLIDGKGEQIPREGCLSVPDFLGNVRRYNQVTVETWTLEGKKIIIRAHGFEALALQHEIDHLDGKLFLDRISNLKTDLFRRKTYQ